MRSRPDITALQQIPPFAACDPAHLVEVAAHTDLLRLPAGRLVAAAGATSREMVAVRTGQLTRNRVPVVQVGGAELLARAAHEADVWAATDVELVVIDGPALRWLVQADPTVGTRLLHWVGGAAAGPLRREVTPERRDQSARMAVAPLV